VFGASWVSSLLNPLDATHYKENWRTVTAPPDATEFGGESLDLERVCSREPEQSIFSVARRNFSATGSWVGDAAASFGFTKAAQRGARAAVQARTRQPPDHQVFAECRFDQKERLPQAASRVCRRAPIGELTGDDFGDARVDDGVRRSSLAAIVENDGAKFCPVNAATRSEHGLPEFLRTSS